MLSVKAREAADTMFKVFVMTLYWESNPVCHASQRTV